MRKILQNNNPDQNEHYTKCARESGVKVYYGVCLLSYTHITGNTLYTLKCKGFASKSVIVRFRNYFPEFGQTFNTATERIYYTYVRQKLQTPNSINKVQRQLLF